MHKRWKGDIITPVLIARVQWWLRTKFGIESLFLIEWTGEKNRLILRVTLDGCIKQAEVRALNNVRRYTPNAAPEKVLCLFIGVD